jgi:LCP family protein required for cell wall assembly
MGRHSAQGAPRLSIKKRSRARGGKEPGALVEESPRLRIHGERRRQTLKRVLLAIAIGLLVFALGVGAWAWMFLRSVQSDITASDKTNEALARVVSKPEPKQPFTVLLMGSDARPKEEAARADTIIVAKVDPQQKKVWMLSIPRDTKANIPGHGTSKINAAAYYGGAEEGPALMVETVEEFLGVDINYYMELNFLGFQKVVDAMGGVWIDVPTDIDDWKASSHSPGHRASKIDAGYQLLDGEHALTFVRSRDYVDADFGRMRAQQLFFKALAEQSTNMGNMFKVPGLVREVSQYVVTNMSVSDIISFAQTMRGISADDVQTATIPGEWRSPYVVTDEEEKARLVSAFLDGRAFDSEAEPAELRDPSTITVAIRNGAGISGSAGGAASLLTPLGYQITEVGNANQFVYDQTLVVYQGDEAGLANQIATALPQGKVVASRGMYAFSTDILVVVGKDWTGPLIEQ